MRLFYRLRRVLLFDLVVEERRRVRRGHEAAIDLGVDADVLVNLPVRHLDFERLGRLVVADRAQLGGVHPFALHQPALTLILSPDFTFFNPEKSFNLPRTLQGLASFGRWSVEIGVRPKGRAIDAPCVQKHTVPGSTTCFASGSSFALTGVEK